MTYRRDPATWQGAMTRALAAGQEWLAERLGVSPARLRQCANPARVDSLPLHLACEADIACAQAGQGTPLFDEYRRRLVAASAIPPADSVASRLSSAAREALASLAAALDVSVNPQLARA